MPAHGHGECTQSAQSHHVPAPLSECLYPQGDVGRVMKATEGCGRGLE